jgi:hypothetical protein
VSLPQTIPAQAGQPRATCLNGQALSPERLSWILSAKAEDYLNELAIFYNPKRVLPFILLNVWHGWGLFKNRCVKYQFYAIFDCHDAFSETDSGRCFYLSFLKPG